jgi:cell division protein FtsL
MRNWVLCSAILVLLVTGTFVFVIAQRMHYTQTELASLNRAINKERDSLRVLQAEWTYLNNPARLEKIATTLFSLQPVDGRQYASVKMIPTMSDMERIEVAQQDEKTGKARYDVNNTASYPAMQAMTVSMTTGGVE